MKLKKYTFGYCPNNKNLGYKQLLPGYTFHDKCTCETIIGYGINHKMNIIHVLGPKILSEDWVNNQLNKLNNAL